MKKTIVTSILIVLLMPIAPAHSAAQTLNTKGNKSSCKFIKENYKSEIIVSWANGLASDQEVLKEIGLNIKMLTAKQKPTTGKIKTAVTSWIKAEKNTKNAITNNNFEAITSAMSLKISSVTNFDKLCKSIEK